MALARGTFPCATLVRAVRPNQISRLTAVAEPLSCYRRRVDCSDATTSSRGLVFRGSLPDNKNSIQTASYGLQVRTAPKRMVRVSKRLITAGSETTNDEGMFYSSVGLDRAAERRSNPEWLRAALEKADTQVVPLWQCKSLIKDRRGVLLSAADLEEEVQREGRRAPVFLGLVEDGTRAVFAVDVSQDSRADGEGPSYAAAEGAAWVDLRREGPSLPGPEASLLAYARGLMEWHARNAFCPRCASAVNVKDAGHALKCSSPSCGASAYPRLDPAVIMLVTCGDHVLLGRQARWDQGRYSLLAGFVELGETFEMAVAREVREEAGVLVDLTSVKYAASQPWPFPCSLMIGFCAQVVPTSSSSQPAAKTAPDTVDERGHSVLLTAEEREAYLGEALALPTPLVDVKELQDARWVHKDFLRAVLFRDSLQKLPPGVRLTVPGKYAIARRLLEEWAKSEQGAERAGGSKGWAGEEFSDVEIDTGVFKYVLLRVTDGNGNSKLVVRGDRLKAFHADVLEGARAAARPLGLLVVPLGGGRIEHLPEQQIINIYGFSQAFGLADHAVSAAILRRWYPFHQTTTSDEGY